MQDLSHLAGMGWRYGLKYHQNFRTRHYGVQRLRQNSRDIDPSLQLIQYSTGIPARSLRSRTDLREALSLRKERPHKVIDRLKVIDRHYAIP